jgi:uncharacterized protein (DUF952 family)/glutathione S-transferase
VYSTLGLSTAHYSLGQLPYIEHGEVRLAQSGAISHYFSKLAGLQGSSAADYAMSEMLTHEGEDLFMLNVHAHYPKSGGFGDDATASWANFDEKVPVHFTNLEKLLTKPSGLFCSSVTMGDLAIYAAINLILDNSPRALTGFPKLSAFYNKMSGMEGPRRVAALQIPAYFKRPVQVPKRVFKLCVTAESEAFQKSGKICSSLDTTDGFIHLSDRNSVPVVAKLFFTEAKDLRLIELDASGLDQTEVNWIVGKMGDAEPDAEAQSGHDTTVHYLVPDGCVHVYGKAGTGVTTGAIVREEHIPLGADGVHIFPEWL